MSETVKTAEGKGIPLDRRRYWRLVLFGARAILTIVWWEIILRRLLGSELASQGAEARYGRIGRELRALAIEMGGVLIKLGQFLSIRVDVLPEYFTRELSGLQDEVPAETFADICGVIEGEFGKPLKETFVEVDREPRAAASLAQVHRATLPDGQSIVLKVQRPGIERLVNTDLAALRTVVSWLKRYRPISRRANLDALMEEFSRTLHEELDFIAEGHNAEEFAKNFADDPSVYMPKPYWSYTTRRVLALEDVASIKITDYSAIEEARVSRHEVATRLFDAYLRQFFYDHFMHADPHPGNLFVRPLVDEPVDPQEGRPFVLVFVDFGMVARIPQRLWDLLVDAAIAAILKRDFHRVVEIYQEAGMLLPGADLERIRQAEEKAMGLWYGKRMGEMRAVALEYMNYMFKEYRDLIYEAPFQFPADLLFAVRTVAVLSGLVTSLDPDFDIWAASEPFVRQLAAEKAVEEVPLLLDRIKDFVLLMLSLPGRADTFFTKAIDDRLKVQMLLPPETQEVLEELHRAIDRLMAGLVFTGLLLAGVLLRINEGPSLLSTLCFVSALLALTWTLRRRRRS